VLCAGLTLSWPWLRGWFAAAAIVAADVAVAVPNLIGAARDPAGAPMWLVAAMTGTSFGLPHPNANERA